MKNSSPTPTEPEAARIEKLIDELLDKVNGGADKCFPCVKPIPSPLCAAPKDPNRPG